MGPRWHVRVAARTGAGPRIGGEASPTPDREPSCMGGPGPHAYRGGHGHLRPVSRRADPAVPPRPVVAAGLEPRPVPGRGHPGAALRAAHRGAPVVVVHHPVMGRFPWAPELGEGVAGTAAPPDDRVPRGAGVHRDPAAPAARPGRGADPAAAGHTRPAERNRDRRDGPRAGHLAPARLPPAGPAGPGRGRRHRVWGVAVGGPFHRGVRGPRGRCWARAVPRSWNTGWNAWLRPGPAWSTPPTPSGGAWSGTCTTAPSSGWSRSRCGWAWPAPNAPTRRRRDRSSPRPTRRPRPPCSSFATWSAACTRRCSRTAVWTRRCPAWRRG